MRRALVWLQRHMLWLLLSTYLVGALAPSLGLYVRALSLFRVPGGGDAGAFSVPMAMIGMLLFVAGLSAKLEAVGATLRRPSLVLAGLTANATYPIAFVIFCALLLARWRSVDEAQSVLIGLGLVGAMPIAGASAAWSQNTGGNVAVSLGLVWGSTLLSPVISPLVLSAVSFVTTGAYASEVRHVAHHGATPFLVLAVVVPSLLGLIVQRLVGRRAIERVLPGLVAFNLVDLLALSYVNAAASLPQAVRHPDTEFIVLVLALTVAMCAGAFGIGWTLPRWLHARPDDQTAMMFGLGMSNNGTGLVLAQATLPGHPRVLLAIILYNVVQQIGAGIVDASRRRVPGTSARVARDGHDGREGRDDP